MKRMDRTDWGCLTVIIVGALMFVTGVIGNAYSQSTIQPPPLTGDALFKMFGQCQAEKNLKDDYINQLHAEIARLQSELKKAVPPEGSK